MLKSFTSRWVAYCNTSAVHMYTLYIYPREKSHYFSYFFRYITLAQNWSYETWSLDEKMRSVYSRKYSKWRNVTFRSSRNFRTNIYRILANLFLGSCSQNLELLLFCSLLTCIVQCTYVLLPPVGTPAFKHYRVDGE